MDDEQKTAQLFHSALNTLKGINVFEFTDPILALEHLKINKLHYAVMISDLRMPVINGVQLLKTVKDLNPSTRTILMTGYDIDNSLLQEYTKKEIIDCFLRKPIELDRLLTWRYKLIKIRSTSFFIINSYVKCPIFFRC